MEEFKGSILISKANEAYSKRAVKRGGVLAAQCYL